ncbi:MAG TPA: Fic family protein [Blastocatellia bacterium]|nr:Fic family protein [Blastocatellia bacterium]
MCDLMDRANRALGRLDGVTVLLPDEYLFTYFYVRKEAVLSSQIEGTQSTLSQLLLFEIEEVPGVPIDDAKEVLNYVRAMQWGLSSIASSKRLPLSLRLIKEIHSLLLDGNRGGDKDPGEFRRYQNWVGGSNPSEASFVGPPPDRVAECMNEFEKFLHDLPEKTPVLMKAALAHVQFETIHPFGDGNGRLGRLLITLLLCAEGALRQPMLYLSLFFKTNREQYYEKLQQVRNDGDWEGWLRFFLQGVEETAQQAVGAAQAILKLFAQDRDRIVTLKQQATAALRIHEILQKRPILSIKRVAERLSLSIPTATKGMQNLERLGIVREITEKDRYRLYMYQPYVDILNEGTTPLR